MAEPERIDGVRYHAVDDGYFEKRGLRKYAGVWSLRALGVGAVISGGLYGRRHLVKSPEEAFAICHRSKSGVTAPGIAD